MNENSIIQIVALVGWLVLAIGAFASFRLSWREGLRMALVWAAIFTGAALLISLIL